MICWHCTNLFSGPEKQDRCKINGRIIPAGVLLGKKPYKDCPVEPFPRKIKVEEEEDTRADEEKYYPKPSKEK